MQELALIEVRGQRVLTTKQIAECYECDRKTISYNFQYNRKRYREGKHYIELRDEELRQFKNRLEIQDSLKHASVLYLWTEKGALLHAKSLNTDKAWEVYDYLVDFYFRAMEQAESKKKAVVPVTVKTEQIKDDLPIKYDAQKDGMDAISTLKVLMRVAEETGLIVKSKALTVHRSELWHNRIAVRNGLSLEEVNFEIAFELFHAAVNYDKGNMIDTPLAKYYHSQADRAAELIIKLLNAKIA